MKLNVKNLGISLATAAAALVPSISFAAFSDGMVIPSGTTTNLTSAVDTYFFTTVLATVFQAQMIQILVVLAAIVVMWRLLKFVWKKFHSPAR